MPTNTRSDTITKTDSLRRSGRIQRICGAMVLQKKRVQVIQAYWPKPVSRQKYVYHSTLSCAYHDSDCSLR